MLRLYDTALQQIACVLLPRGTTAAVAEWQVEASKRTCSHRCVRGCACGVLVCVCSRTVAASMGVTICTLQRKADDNNYSDSGITQSATRMTTLIIIALVVYHVAGDWGALMCATTLVISSKFRSAIKKYTDPKIELIKRDSAYFQYIGYLAG